MSEERKSRYTESQAKAAKKYLTEKVEEFKVRVPLGKKGYYKAAADSSGESLNQFAIRAMDYLIESEKITPKNK